jgi:D-mannonate dehydratase
MDPEFEPRVRFVDAEGTEWLFTEMNLVSPSSTHATRFSKAEVSALRLYPPGRVTIFPSVDWQSQSTLAEMALRANEMIAALPGSGF